MAYTTLYRKWRPQVFEDVRGQDHVVTALRNQINLGRVGHAYLFCGTRGTGKTSIAKIFARAVNCENPQNGSPCNECPTCKAILSGASMNVTEIDGASNRKVEDARSIIEEVRYSPTSGKYKVYIIDEVHMLTPEAFNALLKTIEEPPSYVLFILATTDPQKVPVTIQSRCQRYDFRRIGLDTVEDQLRKLTQAEGIRMESKALRYIARTADGSMRDALSLLEQCAAFYVDDELTYEKVLDILGAVDTQVFARMLSAIQACDVSGAMAIIREVLGQGRDLMQFVTDFVWYLRSLLLLQTGTAPEDVMDTSQENLAELSRQARSLSMEQLMRYLRLFSELPAAMRASAARRVLLEVSVIKAMMPPTETDTQSLAVRIEALERAVASGTVPAAPAQAAVQAAAAEPSAPEPEPENIVVTQAVFEDFKLIRDNWNRIIHAQEPLVAGFLRICEPAYSAERGFEILCPSGLAYLCLQDPEYLRSLSETVEKQLHRRVTFTARQKAPDEKAARLIPENGRIPGINMDVHIDEGE